MRINFLTVVFIGLFSCWTGGARGFSSTITIESLADCPGGDVVIGTYKDKIEIRVFGGAFRTLDEMKDELNSQGLAPIGLVNTGYFNGKGSVSFYKSTLNQIQHPTNSARSPRACFVQSTGGNSYSQSTEENYLKFLALPQAEITCAGPQVIKGGVDVADKNLCDEQFIPHCRDDKRDPGINYYSNYPRTSSCVTATGEFKIFAFTSYFKKCGITGKGMTQFMLKQGCIEGMNHDGGGSAKIYLRDADLEITRIGVENRAVPVWLAIIQK